MEFLLEASDQPWWVAVVTGAGGALVLSVTGCIVLWRALEKSRVEVSDITKESVTVITKILTREELAAENQRLVLENNKDIREGIDRLISHAKGEENWKREVSATLDKLLKAVER